MPLSNNSTDLKSGLTYAALVRRLFLILLALVLPLRAVAGDLMALGMAQMHSPQTTQSAPMPADCPMHTAGPGKHHDSPSQSGEVQCESCALCFPVAQLAEFPALQRPEYPQARPQSGDADFLSATLARSLRPPSL